MAVNEKILGPFSEDEKETFEIETKKFAQELAEYIGKKAELAYILEDLGEETQ